MLESKLHVFNPCHDLALANRSENYMPPAAARQLASDLALLPVWYGGNRDFVLAGSAYNEPYLKVLRGFFPALPRLLTEQEVAPASQQLLPAPWGWDFAVRKRLSVLGISRNMLPPDSGLEQIRHCSHRSLAVELLRALQLNDCFCGESFFFPSIGGLESFVESHPVCVLKAPLSGSGKGLSWCRGTFTSHIRNWCLNIIKQQGGVVGEPLFDKAEDFAMEFFVGPEGNVTFSGYSLFHTNASGAYEGNWLASDADIVRRLSAYVPVEALELLKERLRAELEHKLQGRYCGYLGVDMMICRYPEGCRIHPCVEINLRMNMGIVARLLYDRYVQPGVTGTYRILFYASNEALQNEHRRMEQAHPLTVSDGRIREGYLPLAPVTPSARYLAFVCAGPLSFP